jgi:hypothetical protein
LAAKNAAELLKKDNYEVRGLQEDMWCFLFYISHKIEIERKVEEKQKGKKE